MQEDNVNWTKIYSSTDAMEIAIIKGLLNDYEIPVVEMNKQDTAYVSIGEIDLLVPEVNNDAARLILMNFDREK